MTEAPARDRSTESNERFTRFIGATNLAHVRIVFRTRSPRRQRETSAAAMASTLRAARILVDSAGAGESSIFVDVTLRLTPSDISKLVEVLPSLCAANASVGDGPALPPLTPTDLATALIFDVGSNTAGGGVNWSESDMPVQVFLSVSADEDATFVASLRERILGALQQEKVGEYASEQFENPGRVARQWVYLPGTETAHVRWYRFLTPPESSEEQLARSLANVLFGGVYHSQLVRRLRDQRALSYSPSSSLMSRDGRNAVVVDVSTSRGLEDDSDDAIREALDDFVEMDIDDESLHLAKRYLRGRTIVDADSPAGALSLMSAAWLDPHLPTEHHDLAEHLSRVTLGAVSEAVRSIYRSTEFGALVLSGNEPLEKWTAL